MTADPDRFFGQLYDSMEEYVRRRSSGSYEHRRIAAEVCLFKVPNLLAVLPPGEACDSVLEIGCATGELLAALPARFRTRVGCDISEKNVQVATSRYPGIEFYCGQARAPVKSFDVVILSDVLEHVVDDVGLLKEAAELARLVLINLPLEKCLLNVGRRYGPSDSSGHLRWYGMADAMRLLRSAELVPLRLCRAWASESPYEAARRTLNAEMSGDIFNGTNRMIRTLKKGAAFFLDNVQALRRACLPSNLFVCATKFAR